MYPHIGKFYRKTVHFSGGSARRVASPSYNILNTSVTCDIQPTTADTKNLMGFSFNKEVFTIFMPDTYFGDIALNDLLVINGKAYNILSWLEYNFGGDSDHIEAIVERVPTNPEGVS